MNKKGTVLFMAFMALTYFIFGMMFYQFLKPVIDDGRSDASCTTPETDGDRFTCLFLDGIIPLVIIAILAVAGGIITDKL